MWQGVWGEKGTWARWIALLSSGQAAAVDWSVESSLPLLPVTFWELVSVFINRSASLVCSASLVFSCISVFLCLFSVSLAVLYL